MLLIITDCSFREQLGNLNVYEAKAFLLKDSTAAGSNFKQIRSLTRSKVILDSSIRRLRLLERLKLLFYHKHTLLR